MCPLTPDSEASLVKKRKKLSPQDVAVIRFVVQHGFVTVRRVADHFAEQTGQARTTILTVMERLRSRSWLRRRRIRDVYHYSSTVDADGIEREVVGTFVDEMLAGSVSPFTVWLSQGPNLTPEELGRLKKAVDGLERRTSKRKSRS